MKGSKMIDSLEGVSASILFTVMEDYFKHMQTILYHCKKYGTELDYITWDCSNETVCFIDSEEQIIVMEPF